MTFTEFSMQGIKTHIKTYLVLHAAMSCLKKNNSKKIIFFFVFVLLKGVAEAIAWMPKSCLN